MTAFHSDENVVEGPVNSHERCKGASHGQQALTKSCKNHVEHTN